MSADESSNLPALPPDITSLLVDARRIEAPPVEVRARLRERLATTLPPSGGGGGGHALPSAMSASRAPWWLVAAAFVVGVGGGRLSATTATPPAVAEARNEKEQPPRPVESAAVTEREPISVRVSDLPTVNAPNHPPPSASTKEKTNSDLAGERRILTVARTALARDDGTNALAACDEHLAKFPHGALAEEREAIAVQALVESKRFSEAKARGERFRAAYPKSILLPAVVAAIEEGP